LQRRPGFCFSRPRQAACARSLADAEAGKDYAEQVVGREFAGDFVHRIPAREVVQEQHRIGAGNFVPGAGDANAFSTSSSLSRSPAVSMTCSGTPSIWMVCCTLSRVVPAMGVTMASSAPAKRVEQRAFAGVGLPGNHHLDALAQQRALARALHYLRQRLLQIR
jgi:hypothetical protein